MGNTIAPLLSSTGVFPFVCYLVNQPIRVVRSLHETVVRSEVQTPALNSQGFSSIFGPLFLGASNDSDVDSAFSAFSVQETGRLDVYEVLGASVVCAKASPSERARLLFEVFDFDGSLSLNKVGGLCCPQCCPFEGTHSPSSSPFHCS